MSQMPPEIPLSRAISGLPVGMRVQDLTRAPDLQSLYARAARGAVSAKISGAHSPAMELPAVAYRVRGVRADAELLTGYEDLLDEPADDFLPAGFVHTLAFPVATAVMVRPDFPLPLLGMIHLANAVSVLAPIRIDDELEITAWSQDLAPHKRGVQLNVVAEVRVAGHVVWRGVSTYLAKGTSLPGHSAPDADSSTAPRPAAAESLQADAARPVEEGPVEARSGEHMPARTPTAKWRLGAATGRDYAAVSGDWNPIHLSGLSAKAFGFPRAIAHGMYAAARALSGVGAQRGQTFDWTIEFASPILLPAAVHVAIRQVEAGDGWIYEAWSPSSGRTHFTGSVRTM